MLAASLTVGIAMCTAFGFTTDPRPDVDAQSRPDAREPSPTAIFLVNGTKPDRGAAWRTRAHALAGETAAASPDQSRRDPDVMANHFAGLLARLGPPDLAALRAAVGGARYAPLPESARDFATVRLHAGERSALIQLRRDDSGAVYALSDPGDSADDAPKPQRGLRLAPGKVEALLVTFPRYRGDFSAPAWAEPGRVVPVPQPLTPGSYSLDRARLSARFLRGEPTKIEGSTRQLADESFVIRLPKDFNAKRASGLVVWVHAANAAVVPEQLIPALDDLGFVCIAAANTGNERAAVDRYQLTLDALATAGEHVLIDPARVYTAGISGGGKIASSMWACFPDLFTGVVAIVGISVYNEVPTGDGRLFRADFSQPPAPLLALLRGQHAAAITGPNDFNSTAITGSVKVYERDKIAMKLFDIPALGHEMPTSKVLTEALRYADEPGRQRREKELVAAAALLARAKSEKDPDTRRDLLQQTMRRAPWSTPAWEAHAQVQ